MGETAPKCCLLFRLPQFHRVPWLADGAMPGPSPPGHCAATHPPETDKGDAETPGRADRVGKMKGSESGEAQTRGGGGGEDDVSPQLRGAHRPQDTTPGTHSGEERWMPSSSPPRI